MDFGLESTALRTAYASRQHSILGEQMADEALRGPWEQLGLWVWEEYQASVLHGTKPGLVLTSALTQVKCYHQEQAKSSEWDPHWSNRPIQLQSCKTKPR